MDAECESGNCGSRSFHAGDDGFTYCSEGHRQSRAGLVVAAEDDLEPTGRRSTRKSQNDNDAGVVVLSGKEGLEHYIHCFQLILWKQVHCLITEHGFPAELETVVRDLWTLKLSSLQHRLGSDARSQDGSSKVFSSQGETSDSSTTSRRRFRHRSEDSTPRIIDAVCLIFVGMVLLRLRVTLHDLHDLIQDGSLIYYRATQHLAPGMKSVLSGIYHQMLNPRESLPLVRLQSEARQTFATFSKAYGLNCPAMNANLVLWTWMLELCLPLELHHLTMRLLQRLDITLTYGSSTLPEISLACCLVMAIKLFYPPDGLARFPKSASDPAALAVDWKIWATARPRNASKAIFRQALTTTEADVPTLSGHDMDLFIDFFRKMYTDNEAKAGMDTTLRNLFPLADELGAPSASAGESAAGDTEALRRVQAAMKPVQVKPGNDPDVPRPGSGYARYKTAEELSGTVKEVYGAVAERTGMELQALAIGVYDLERNLEHFVDK